MPLFQPASSLQTSHSNTSVFKFKTRPYTIQDAQGSKTSLVQDAPQLRPTTAVSAGTQSMDAPGEFKIKKSKTFSHIGTLKKRFSFKTKNMRSLSLNDANTPPIPERPKSAPVKTSNSTQKELPPLLSNKHLHDIINEELLKSNKLPLPGLESITSDLRSSSALTAPTNQTIAAKVFAQSDDHRTRLDSIDDHIEGQLKPVYNQLSQVYTQLFDRVNEAIAAKEKELAAQIQKEMNTVQQRPISTSSSLYPEDVSGQNISQFSSMSEESAIPEPLKQKQTLVQKVEGIINKAEGIINKAENVINKAASFISKLQFYKNDKDNFVLSHSQELVQHLQDLKAIKHQLIDSMAKQKDTTMSQYTDKLSMLGVHASIAKEHMLIGEANSQIATLERTQHEHFI